MQPTEHIFVYGLLMFPEIVEAITGQRYQMLDAVLADHQRRGLSQSPLDAPVPVLTEAPGRAQQGKLLLDVGPEAVRALDFFEEIDSGHYVKKAVRGTGRRAVVFGILLCDWPGFNTLYFR